MLHNNDQRCGSPEAWWHCLWLCLEVMDGDQVRDTKCGMKNRDMSPNSTYKLARG